MSNKISISLPNGCSLSGDAETVAKTAKQLGYTFSLEEYHFSDTKKQYILISDMDTNYLKNTIAKKYREWLRDVANYGSLNFIFTMALASLDSRMFEGHLELKNLVLEYVKRTMNEDED